MSRWRQRHDKSAYRSGFEKDVAEQLTQEGIDFVYEDKTWCIQYVQPEKQRKYTPDFPIVLPSGKVMYIETKGRFVTADRQKHLWIKDQMPQLDIRFVFYNPNAKLYKGSKTTYADWCEKNGFKWAPKRLPEEWLREIKK